MKKNKLLLFIILIFPYIEPLSFKDIPLLDKVYSAMKILWFFIICLIYFLNLRKNGYKISKFIFLVVLFQVELYISTLFNSGSYSALFGQTVSIIASVMLMEMYIKDGDAKIALLGMSSILFAFSLINIITMVFENNFNYKESYSFLGMDNRYIFFLLPLCIFSITYSLQKYNKLNFFAYLVIATSAFQLIYSWAVGAVLTIILLIAYVLVFDKIKFLERISFKTYFIIILVYNILLVFLQVQYYFEDFLVNYLHKNADLSGRVYTWNLGIKSVKEHFFLGIGGQTPEVMQSIYYKTNQHAHNLFLNVLVNGGVISLTILFVMYLQIGKKLSSCKNKKISSILSFSIFLILFLSIADTFDTYIVYIIYTLAYHVNELEFVKEENINNE